MKNPPEAYRKYQVEVPDEKGIVIKHIGSKKESYVYKKTEYFRNKNGVPSAKSFIIGKLDEQTGKMTPNKNYFTHYNVAPLLREGDVLQFGFSYLVEFIADKIGLRKTLVQSMGEQRADLILAVAVFIIQNGNVLDDIDDWQIKTYLPKISTALNSQSTSDLFKNILASERNAFFKGWIKASFKGGAVCYDVTSISSYSEVIPGVEFGHNRDGEKLGQFNLGAFCDEESKLPLYYNFYNGSLTDRTNLAYVLKDAYRRGLKSIKIIVDGGFWSLECFDMFSTICEAFTVGMPSSLKEARAIVEEHRESFGGIEDKIETPHLFCKRIPKQLNGCEGDVLLYFNAIDHAVQGQELCEKINRLEIELSKLKRLPAPDKQKKYLPYFKLEKEEGANRFVFSRDSQKINERLQVLGFFLIFTTDKDSSPDDILYYYRAKDVAEKLFQSIKDYMDGDRLRTHTEETTEGKIFVTFVASILRTYLSVKMTPWRRQYSKSVKDGIKELSNIKAYFELNEICLTKALTKKQRELLLLFGCESLEAKDL